MEVRYTSPATRPPAIAAALSAYVGVLTMLTMPVDLILIRSVPAVEIPKVFAAGAKTPLARSPANVTLGAAAVPAA